jgi:hypothetical protein
VSLDFDGSVLSTHRRAEGVAAGYNKKKKGTRSYYPLFCTLAQTGLIRPGSLVSHVRALEERWISS